MKRISLSWVRQLKGVFKLFVALALVSMTLDTARLLAQSSKAVESIRPDLSDLAGPAIEIAPLSLSADRFSASTPQASDQPEAAIQGSEWKLKGVMMGRVKRALVQEVQTQGTTWVTQEQTFGPWKVLEIHPRHLILEKEGVRHELAM